MAIDIGLIGREEALRIVKASFAGSDLSAGEAREISFGFQMGVSEGGRQVGFVRIYFGKRGTTVDLSAINGEAERKKIHEAITAGIDRTKYFAGKKESVGSRKKKDKLEGLGDKGVIGIDESGKGDYFGSLVVAAVLVEPNAAAGLSSAGVRDSKLVSDKKIFELEKIIKEKCVHDVVIIGPKSYNNLYEKLGNLNKLLAWGHARTLENVLKKAECGIAVSDKFGDEKFVKNALMEKGKEIRLIQAVKAERNVSVAAASILARAGFLRSLNSLSREIGIKLPKGSSDPSIKEIAKEILEKNGKEKLGEFAKLHFKTTGKISEA